MRTLRRLRSHEPRRARRRSQTSSSGGPDATVEPHPELPPEAVFDRITGPYGARHYDEET